MLFQNFSPFSNLKYDFSRRSDGSMNRHLEHENRARYFTSVGIAPDRVVTPDLVHGSHVVDVSDKDGGTMIASADALITNAKNLFLSATAADCLLLYFFDPAAKAIGIAHAGWRGLLAGVVENTVSVLMTKYGVDPKNLLVCIAPSIRACHFEISAGDKEKFLSYPSHISEREGRIFVSLQGIAREKLESAGISQDNIEDSGVCTHCNEHDYFSFRRDKPKDVEVMVGYIVMT